jgi:hypothetical protein
MNDGYMGSGSWVKSIKNKKTLTKEIIEYTDCIEKLKLLEQKYINENFGKHNCMNFSMNSSGGFFASGKEHPSFGKPAVNKNKPMTEEQKEKISKALFGKNKSIEHKNKISKKLSKKWIVTDPNGKNYKVDKSLKQFCLTNNLTYNCLLLVSRGKRLHHKGWKCIENVGTNP